MGAAVLCRPPHLLSIRVVQIEPDEQYSGGSGNLRVHQLLVPLLSAYGLDGTYINDLETDEECGGPTEVVLTRAGIPRITKI